jgi:secreted PhoX family phosphatase
MYGQLPSPIAVLTLDQDRSTGELRLVKYHNVDTSKAHGLWITCGASLSPWNTHLGSEEYEPDAVAVAQNARFRAFSRNFFGDPAKANPYHYGHVPEVTVHADGTGTLKKHYCLGRISHEVVQVMPDRRTVLMGDDATNGGLFMFVSDRPADLSSGTLYVAKCSQQAGVALGEGGVFDLEWLKLGHAGSDEIERLADSLTAADIVEVRQADPHDPAFKAIHINGKPQWVRFVPGREKAAAFLETHRWAAAAGGTLAFTKMEGVALNARDRVAYLAMSYIYQSMADGKSGIKVAAIRAGAVYQLPMAGGQKDLAGAAIDSDWVPLQLAAVPGLIGKDLAAPDAVGNLADAERIANPDNLKFSERLRTLFVGEDSGMHVNNFLWAYNVDTRALARVLSCPAGAESTGLQAADDVGGFAYLMSNFQHAGDWEKPLHDKVRSSLAPLVDRNYRGRRSAAVGYLEGLPQPAAA